MKQKHEERRAFLGKVAAVSIATAFGGGLVATRSEAAFKVTKDDGALDKGKPKGSALEDGDLGKLAQTLNEHPDAAVRAVLSQTAEGLATKESARNQFSQNVHGALKSLNIDVPKDILPARLNVPDSVKEAAAKRKGWGIGAGHSNRNYWTYHNNYTRYSDYSDWW